MIDHDKPPTMPRSLFRAWLAALRSGDYKQGRRYLYSDGCHCVFGVLCEIAPNIERRLFDATRDLWAYREKGVEDFRHEYVCIVPDCLGVINRWKVVEWNDGDNLSFEEIANLLEAEPTRFVRFEDEGAEA
jgi:hypothetical protein